MIPAPLSLISQTLLLGDSILLDQLISTLLEDSGGQNQQLLTRHLPEAIESRYPRCYRVNETVLAKKWVEAKGNDLNWLEALFDDYFCFVGDRISAREDKRSNYAQLCAQIHPAFPVAWKLAGMIDKQGKGLLHISDLRRILDNSSSNFLPPLDQHRHWADLHVHLGGACETSLSLFSMAIGVGALPKDKLPSGDHDPVATKWHKHWRATYSVLFVQLLGLLNDHVLEKTVLQTDLEMAWKQGHCKQAPFKVGSWLKLHRPIHDHSSQQLAYWAIRHFQHNNAQQAWLYWLTALFIQFRHSSHQQSKTAILAFLHLAQFFRRDMIHDGVGLSRFVRYYNNGVRKAAIDRQSDYDGLRQLLENKQQFAEIKATEWLAEKDKVAQFIKEAAQLQTKQQHPSLKDIENLLKRLHGCIHFIRKPNNKENLRYANRRHDSLRQAIKINRFLVSATAANYKIRDCRQSDKTLPVNLTRMVRGLDVAGDELATATEAYAPAIRWLRRGIRRSLAVNSHELHHLHLSIHAGEDFNHLLGGLRHMDETLEFCEMSHHDRFGHGLALGINPQQWFNAHQEVFLTVEEHLDNLVWAWRQAQEMTGIWPDTYAVAMRLEARIRLYALIVYPNFKNEVLSPDILYQAWHLRRNCPLKWRKYRLNRSQHHDLRYWVPDFDKTNAQEQELPYRLYLDYLDVKNKPKKKSVVLIKAGERLPSLDMPLQDWQAPVELAFMEALQDWLMTRYAQKGLVIEVNPSSNIFISRIEDYQYHPVFRWYPPREKWLQAGERYNLYGLRCGIMPVCINTDDPGIFPTNLQNEFLLLKEAAINHHNIGPLEAERWLNELREAGVAIFKHVHQYED